MTNDNYPRDLAGYGRNPPHARWPGGARIAVQFVLNVEEGGENNVLHGDPTSETFLSELVTAQAYENRHMTMESMYEYGSRAGVWRILREFDARKLPLTIFGVGDGAAAHARSAGGVHGPRRRDRQPRPALDPLPEPAGGDRAAPLDIATRVSRSSPAASGRSAGTPAATARTPAAWSSQHGGYEYDSDYYGDDLPFWTEVDLGDGTKRPHLVVPYSLDANDMRFVQAQGFNTGEHFFVYLRDSFDALYAEGDPDGLDRPKMMSIGMHSRLLGKPGRIGALQRFLDHIGRHDQVWVARRIDIARHWKAVHPFAAAAAAGPGVA